MEEKQKSAELEINSVSDLKEKLEKAIETSKNKPTEAEIEAAKVEFEEASKAFPTKSWNIGEPADAREFLSYIRHFVNNRLFWTKTGWMGVVKMVEELDDSEKFINMNPNSPMKIGYQALEFLFYSLQNPGGVGFQSAKSFESENERFVKIFEATGKTLSEARAELNNIQFLQDKYAAMQQGFYLELESKEEEKEEIEVPKAEENEEAKEA